MTTQHYFEKYLQKGDTVRVVGWLSSVPQLEQQGILYKEGVVKGIYFWPGFLALVEVEGQLYRLLPEEFEPITWHDEPRPDKGVILTVSMPDEAAQMLMEKFAEKDPELMDLLKPFNIIDIGMPIYPKTELEDTDGEESE